MLEKWTRQRRAFTSSRMMKLKNFSSNAKTWLKAQADHEPTEQEDRLAGFILFLFVVLWTLAGPQ